ncbi:MAG: DUF2269 family protein [Actinobacteria bacterium]|nr:DUF2269 family protein [Actinomycetota bacterium]
MYDWLLFFHVLAAFALVSAVVVFSVLSVAGWRTDRPSAAVSLFRLSKIAAPLIIAGSLLTLVLGIWLAIYLDGYQVWDGWILASIAFWAVATVAGQQSGRDYIRARQLATRLVDEGKDEPSGELRALLQSRHGLILQLISYAAVLVVLILMIYKPGA